MLLLEETPITTEAEVKEKVKQTAMLEKKCDKILFEYACYDILENLKLLKFHK